MTTCPASVADLRPSGYLRPSLPPFLLSPFLSPSRAPLFLPRRGVRGRRVLPPAPSDSAASGRVWACAAPPRARLRVCVCVCERGRGTIWCGFSSSLAPGKASAGGGAARRSLPTCILALLRFHPFLRCACEHVRWRRRAGGRLGLPAALGGFLRLRRYCPFPLPPPVCKSGRQTIAWFAATCEQSRHSAVAATCCRCVSNPSVRSCE